MNSKAVILASNSDRMSTTSRYHVSDVRISEELAWIEAAKKDPAAFEPLYNRYHEPIFRYILQRVTDKDAAFDATADVFLKALLNLYRFEFRGVPFSSWLYRIAANVLNDLFKSRKVRRAIHIDTAGLQLMAEEARWEDIEHMEFTLKMLGVALSELKDEEVQLIEMRFFEKRPFKEIAEIMGLTENNTKVKLYRLLDKIKQRLQHKHP